LGKMRLKHTGVSKNDVIRHERAMYSQVQKNDGDLRRNNDDLVDVLFPVKQLEHQGDSARLDGPDVSAHAMVDHDIDEDGGRDDTKPCQQDHRVVPSKATALDEPTRQEADYEDGSRDAEQDGTDQSVRRSGVSYWGLAGFLLPCLRC
jgi:hypothetical protein